MAQAQGGVVGADNEAAFLLNITLEHKDNQTQGNAF